MAQPSNGSEADILTAVEECISQLRYTAPRRPPELAEACSNVLNKLKSNGDGGSAPALRPDECLKALVLGCAFKGNASVVSQSLVSLQRLLPTGFFRGHEASSSTVDSEGAADARRLLMDIVIEAVCSCEEQADDGVQLRLIRVLSIAVTSPTCEVHGKSLMRAVSACFKIYKMSTSQSNQRVAQAGLTQIVSNLVHLSVEASNAASPTSLGDQKPGHQTLSAEGSELASWVLVPNPTDELRKEWVASYMDAILDQVVKADAERKRSGISKAKHGQAQDTIVSGAPMNLLLKDALLVLLSFSKQSMKDSLPGQKETQFLRSKRISLEMILCMIETADTAFMQNEHCIRILREILCLSIIKNSVSALTPDVFELSLKIFVTLVVKCRRHIKPEIGIIIMQILLPMLSSANSTYQHKQTALSTILRLCDDAQIAIELFLNFDCSLGCESIFEIIAELLSQIAQGKYTAYEYTSLIDPQQETELKQIGLKALVSLSTTMADWAYRTPQAIANSSDRLNSVMERRQRKLAFKKGVLKFNMHPKKGVAELKQSGFINDDPLTVARLFMRENSGLNKTVVGDYLGENKPFNINVLQALIDAQNFKDLGVDTALRVLLANFRLPGEAQKIDRIIDGFAKKYCHDNPDAFANSDTAHILAFSVMMLQTDLHNDQIKNKMSKAAFVSNNRGINDGKDLAKEYLEGLYDSICDNPFTLKDDDKERVRLATQQAQTAAQKLQLFAQEAEDMMQNAQSMLQHVSIDNPNDAVFISATSRDHAGPAFNAACWPLLAAFSTVLQEVDDDIGTTQLCVEGLQCCVKVAAIFESNTKRDALVSALAMFTYLMTLKEIRQKNVECIKALLDIAFAEGSRLGVSWQHVLQCISRLDQLQLIGTKSRPDFQYFNVEDGGHKRELTPGGRNMGAAGITTLLSTGLSDDQIEAANSQYVMSQVDSNRIDHLFQKSASLDAGAIVGFVVQLVRVSREELVMPDKPRVFSLHKLIEVADLNMSRENTVWTQIWEPLSQHLIEVAAHSNPHVSVYAIDSLRQLATRFLDKEESGSADMRAEVLRPFEVMMVSARRMGNEAKTYVVDAVLNIVQSRTHRIRSGWTLVLHILRVVAQEEASEDVLQRAFTAVTSSLRHKCLFEDHFQDTIKTASAFANCQVSLATSVEAIKCLRLAADYLHALHTNPSASNSQVESFGSDDQANSGIMGSWLFILRCLSSLVGDPRQDVKLASLETFFEILCDRGADFEESGWQLVMRDIAESIFDVLHKQLTLHGAQSISTITPLYLVAVKALARIFDTTPSAMTPPVLQLALTMLRPAAMMSKQVEAAYKTVGDAASESIRQLLVVAERDQRGADCTALLQQAAGELA